jgi:transcriptional regulator with XRE-family HTH domain
MRALSTYSFCFIFCGHYFSNRLHSEFRYDIVCVAKGKGMLAKDSVSERIKEVRHVLKLSQVKFSEAIYISNGYLAEIELGNRRVNERIIQLITTTFGVNKEWLKTGQGNMFISTPDEKCERIAALFKELNPEFQDYVLSQMDQLINLQNRNELQNRSSAGKEDAR